MIQIDISKYKMITIYTYVLGMIILVSVAVGIIALLPCILISLVLFRAIVSEIRNYSRI
jgi:hypothetical protein